MHEGSLESTPFNPPQTREGEDQIYATLPFRLCDLLAHLMLILRTSVRISNISSCILKNFVVLYSSIQ